MPAAKVIQPVFRELDGGKETSPLGQPTATVSPSPGSRGRVVVNRIPLPETSCRKSVPRDPRGPV